VSNRSHPSDPDHLVDLLEAMAAELFIWLGHNGIIKSYFIVYCTGSTLHKPRFFPDIRDFYLDSLIRRLYGSSGLATAKEIRMECIQLFSKCRNRPTNGPFIKT